MTTDEQVQAFDDMAHKAIIARKSLDGVKFKGASSGAPFPSLIAIYGTPRTPRYGVFTKRA